MMQRLLFGLSMLVIFAWLTVVGLDLYDRYWPIKIIEHHFDVAKVLNVDKKVKRGEYLEFEYLYSKHKNIKATISRSFVNDRVVHLTCEVGAFLPGLKQRQVQRIFVPENMWPGKYKLITHMNYRISNNREENISYETEWFEVLP